jgi:hypothetical protein
MLTRWTSSPTICGWSRWGTDGPANNGVGVVPKRLICDQVMLPARAIVRPDETITFTDDGWAALFLEENGL